MVLIVKPRSAPAKSEQTDADLIRQETTPRIPDSEWDLRQRIDAVIKARPGEVISQPRMSPDRIAAAARQLLKERRPHADIANELRHSEPAFRRLRGYLANTPEDDGPEAA